MSKTHRIINLFFNHSYAGMVKKNFFYWLNDRAFEKEKDNTLFEIWENLDIKADSSTEDSFRCVEERIKQLETPRKKHSLFITLRKIAAVVLIPLLSFAISYIYIQQDTKTESNTESNEIEFVECFVPHGEIRTIVLPDSSTVQVNSGSVLIYPEKFEGKTRNIFLNGEACFSVTKNETMPFIVKTMDMDIKVLGTVFGISSYANSTFSSTTLEKGRVSVHFNDEQNSAEFLQPNEQIIYDRISGKIEKRTINTKNALAWREGHLIFQSLSINQIAELLERKYGITVYLNSNKYQNEKITAKFIHSEDVNDILVIMKQIIPNFSYKIEDKKKVFIY
ncbi:FecR family protein [Dysgonomonas sp. ZJ709]|uniref:FecR family protein n=1 Tax=Dysgonomonas sp. ZJ709 TaxID=2709797 RepID=UPI0013EDF0CC|nr:FecR family protein [Dysgonomonas sp. ZJ709]